MGTKSSSGSEALVVRGASTPAAPTAADGTAALPGELVPLPPMPPAVRVDTITQTCDVDLPLSATDPRWQDFAAGRGDQVTRKLTRRFQSKPVGRWQHMLFASHRGAGKTTELLRLAAELSSRYLPLYLAANVQMDSNQIEVEDLFLVLAQGVENHLRQMGRPLPEERLARVSEWFTQRIRTTTWGRDFAIETGAGLKAEAGLSLFGKLTAHLTALLKVESKYRDEIKSELKRFPGMLLDSVNLLLDAAAEILRADGKELLILIDNLDRYPPDVIDKLLVQNGDRLRQLHCNLILTPPIGLLYRPHSEQIDTHFPCEVMNTVRLRRREQPYDAFDGPGRELLLAALSQRMDIDRLLPDGRARDRLVMASGGAIRELLSLVVDAALLADGDEITLADIERVVQGKKQRLRDLINANGWWDTLAKIARDKEISEDRACMDVLFHRLALKYNGEGWYDVQPLVAELPKFKHAFAQLSQPT